MTSVAVDDAIRFSDAGDEPFATYRSYVDGQDRDGAGWVYVLSVRALLDDAFASLT